jgi:hypothetical protein
MPTPEPAREPAPKPYLAMSDVAPSDAGMPALATARATGQGSEASVDPDAAVKPADGRVAPAPRRDAPPETAAPRRAPTPDERYAFRRLYLELLGRPPSEDELAVAAAAGAESTADRLLAGRERWDSWFEDELYGFLLIDEFRPGADRMGDLPGRLAARRIGVRDALGEIAKSQQFNARNPGNDTYVTVVLEQLLGMTVQKEPRTLEIGKAMYDGRAATLFGRRGRSQADFVDIVLDQPAFAATYVLRRAAALLGAPPPKRELDRLAERLRADPGSYVAIERELVLSAAWRDALKKPRKKSDRAFIACLWHDVLEREPTYQEFRNLRNASQALTDPAGLRSLVIGTMLNAEPSPAPRKQDADAATWISGRFERLLARPPSPEELATFTATWRSEACRPTTVLHALLTSAEYDHY